MSNIAKTIISLQKEERRDLYLEAYSPYFKSSQLIIDAIEYMDDCFSQQWKVEYKTPGVRWRLNQIEKFLGKKQNKPFVLDEKIKNELVISLEEIELKYPIKAMPGAKSFLENWSINKPDIKLGIVSDAIYSPGRCIRQILESLELLEYFTYFSFSDEVGNSKPSLSIFKNLQGQAGVMPHEIIHIGDRVVNDIEGALKFGARGVLCQVHQKNQEKISG